MIMSSKALILVNALTAISVGLILIAVGAILLELVCLVCANSRLPRDRERPSGSIVAGLALLGLWLIGSPALQAQEQATDEVPQLEARYTRVFGSDTVQVVWQRLSPDGRWIVYSSLVGAERTNGMWLVSTDGGEPIQLTSGKWDVNADWFPTSDRIAFQSTRLDETMIMTLAIDTETGRAMGPAQRVTLAGGASPRVSPDGNWIAYRSFESEGVELEMAIMAVPARGGSARTLVQLPGRPWVQSWSRDSRFLYFVSRAPDPQTPGSGLMRVSVDGGDPETVTRLPAGDDAPLNPYQIYRGSGTDASGGPLHVIATADGHRLGQVSLPKNVGDLGHAKRISADGKQVVAVVSNTVSSLKVLPVAGGSARPLGDARTNDVPIGWTPDGRVVFLTVVDGRVGVMAAPVEEGAAEEYTIIPDLHMASYQRPVLLSGDGQYLAFHRNKADSDGSSLTMARASDGETRTVTEAPTDLSLFTVSGPGGPATQGNEILYLETRGEISELRAASFDGDSRLLRAFPIAERRAMGVFGDRVVWEESAGDATEIMVAEGPDDEPSLIASVPALFEGLVWSPDGRWIAGSAYFANGDEHSFKIMLIGVDGAGNVTSEPRFLDTEIGVGWGIRWLPDNRGLTIFAQSLPSYRTDVWLFSTREGESPVALTADETTEFWYYSLSPDGRYIAYPAAVPRGSSIWLVELEDLPEDASP